MAQHTTCPTELMVSAKILAVKTRGNENFWVQFVLGDQKIIAQQVAKWKKPKYLQQRLIWKPKTST